MDCAKLLIRYGRRTEEEKWKEIGTVYLHRYEQSLTYQKKKSKKRKTRLDKSKIRSGSFLKTRTIEEFL